MIGFERKISAAMVACVFLFAGSAAIAGTNFDTSGIYQTRDAGRSDGYEGYKRLQLERERDRTDNGRNDRDADRFEHRQSGIRPYEPKRHGARYRDRRSGYRHFYKGFYYAQPWWLGSPRRPSVVIRP